MTTNLGEDSVDLIPGELEARDYYTEKNVFWVPGAGPLGFGTPRLCVEVKSEETAIDRPTVDKLLGAMTKFGAQEGLFVAWGGFKSNVSRELAPSFFRLRFWTQKELLEQLFANYDRLDEELKAELPLKRIWTVAAQDTE